MTPVHTVTRRKASRASPKLASKCTAPQPSVSGAAAEYASSPRKRSAHETAQQPISAKPCRRCERPIPASRALAPFACATTVASPSTAERMHAAHIGR